MNILTFREAQALLGLSGEETLSAEEERRLGAMMMEQDHELVALIQVPWKQRLFSHMKEVVGAEQLTRSFELFYRGVEITSGAVREHRYPILMQQLAEKGLTGKGMEFYLDSVKLGAPPHGGFGLGLTRLAMLFLGLPGIKEASFIHRGAWKACAMSGGGLEEMPDEDCLAPHDFARRFVEVPLVGSRNRRPL